MAARDPYELERFVTAQDAGGSYAQALRELQQGAKRSHWMWFVFPQLEGLGRSAMAQRYAITGLVEAQAYLAHPVLGPRLLACVHALLDLDATDPTAVLGPVDAQKLLSSLTLFEAAAIGDGRAPFAAACDRYFGGGRDPATRQHLPTG